MSRQSPYLGATISWILAVLIGLTGCHPQQPLYLFNDGDLSHYKDMATEIEFPDVELESLGEVNGAMRPFSLENPEPTEIWEMTLEEAIRIGLANSKVIRDLGGQLQVGQALLSPSNARPDYLIQRGGAPPDATVFDPAIAETNPRFGVEAALSAFDAQFSAGVVPNVPGSRGSYGWSKIDEPRNIQVPTDPAIQPFFRTVEQEDWGGFRAQVNKTAATGGNFTFTHELLYSDSNLRSRAYPSDWTALIRGEFTQPLLQRAGVQYNRIAGPGAIPGFNNGVMIARIRTDISLAEFEYQVQRFVYNLEVAYWNLYRFYRELDAKVVGRDSGLQTWRQIYTKFKVGTGDAAEEAQARNQYFLFRVEVERTLNEVYKAESNLRYLLGLAATDGRLIRPADEPTTAKVTFDWDDAHAEAMCRVVRLRQQRWVVKQRELELIAAKNYLLPRLDLKAMYQWQGLGNDLLESSGGSGDPTLPGSNAYQSLFGGDFQNWGLGIDLNMPIGFRKEMAGVRNAQLSLAREKAVLQEMELEASHQLTWAIREMEGKLVTSQTNFNRRIAAQDEVDTAEAKYEAGVVEGTLDRVLDAQRRLAEAEIGYYTSLVEYNDTIALAHFQKGSLLEYNDIYLAEGPWPGKAYFDARRRARQRDASFYLDYGFTRPKVISRGAYEQHAGRGGMPYDGQIEAGAVGPEMIPTPAPDVDLVPPEPLKPEPAPPDPLTRVTKRAELNADALAVGSSAEEKNPSPSAAAGTESGAGSKWVRSKRAGTQHESLATASAAGGDRPASGWSGI